MCFDILYCCKSLHDIRPVMRFSTSYFHQDSHQVPWHGGSSTKMEDTPRVTSPRRSRLWLVGTTSKVSKLRLISYPAGPCVTDVIRYPQKQANRSKRILNNDTNNFDFFKFLRGRLLVRIGNATSQKGHKNTFFDSSMRKVLWTSWYKSGSKVIVAIYL